MESFNKLQKTTIKNLLKTKNSYERKIAALEAKRAAFNDSIDLEVSSLQSVVVSTVSTIRATGNNLPFEDIMNIISIPEEAEENSTPGSIINPQPLEETQEVETNLSVEATPFTQEDAERMVAGRTQDENNQEVVAEQEVIQEPAPAAEEEDNFSI